MKKIIIPIMMFIILLSTNINAESLIDLKEKENAIKTFNNKKSSDSELAKSILIFEKFAPYDNEMLYFFGKANYEESTTLISLNKEKGIDYIEKAAASGSGLAEYDYAVILIENNRFNDALSYLKSSAKKGISESQYKLGKMYYLGEGLRKNKSNGFKLIFAAAKNGHPYAQYDIAKIYFSQKDENLQNEGIYWLQNSVKNGNLKSCDELYKIYLNGILVSQSKKKHMEYLKCSAINNNMEAKLLMAKYYETGTYVQKDEHKAAYWYKSLAEDKDSEASYKYASYIFKYNARDKEKVSVAIEYLNASSVKNIDSSMLLGFIYKDGRYGLARDNSKAIKYFEIAKELGSDIAPKYILEILNRN